MKRRPRPDPDPRSKEKDEIVHLDDLIPRREVKAGARKIRFGETPERDPGRPPER